MGHYAGFCTLRVRPGAFVDVLSAPTCSETVPRYLIEWLTYLTTRKMRRIDQESRATFQPPRSQDFQLRPLTPVNRVNANFV